ncbi:DUF1501 domain-containing protein [uncultured Paraglaciecola sp.]|uniref:DUF1501 domain-containing protein n=1 Tax=uncultured Paraglaciecola sp. TaxID=1765024 RepID=UPI0030DBE818|tara:strand:+ start:2505 stop:3884 length:1380 start_codon:yes stop_codon:yes gene_type:complete
MKYNAHFNQQRRSFLQGSLSSIAGVTSASGVGLNFALANAALAHSGTRFEEYKALVCVFLYGGNDSLNMLVPTDDYEYQIYQQVRQGLAYSQESLLPINPNSAQPYAVGMPSAMRAAHSLFEQNKLAVVANTGPLLQPVSKLQATQDRSLLPPQLFSHNDQQNHWQSARPEEPAFSGWAGRIAELMTDTQIGLPMNLSIDGINLLQTGTITSPFSLNSGGPEQFAGLDGTKDWNAHRVAAFERLLSTTPHLLEQEFKNVLISAATNNSLIASALDQAVTTQIQYPANNTLAEQLKMVASLASVQEQLGQQRQIFYVGLGGWDTHDNQATVHPRLLQSLSEALSAFQGNIDELGLSEQITTFTMSDFGRTLTSNGDGTDHGWGGHQLIMGGAVKGQELYGTMPALELGSDDDLGDGRIIPTLSVDQYAASLSRWFGLSESELNAVFPNLNRFDIHDLGFF